MDRFDLHELWLTAETRRRPVLAAIGLVALRFVAALGVLLTGDRVAMGRALGTDFQSQLKKPKTIRLGKGGTRTELAANQDYIIKLPKGTKNGFTQITGGRNILIDGGSIALRGRGADLQRRGIYIKDATGTVRIQNVSIRGRGKGGIDAIAISAPRATVQLVNLKVDGVGGTSSGFHGDIVQPFGGVRRLVIRGLTGRTSYQGFYLVETGGKIGSVDMRNVDLSYRTNKQDRTTIMVWFDSCSSYPVRMRNVYIRPRKGQSVIRHAVRSDGCNPRRKGNQIVWPASSKIKGAITQGRPPRGAFVRPRRQS